MTFSVNLSTSAIIAPRDPVKKSKGKANVVSILGKSETNKTSEQLKKDSEKAQEELKKQGYKIYNSEGRTIIENQLGHKSVVAAFYVSPNGAVGYTEFQVQYIDPSQRERAQKRLFGEQDTPEEAEKYKNQALAIMKKAGYKVQENGDCTYNLTTPDGKKSKISNITIDLDGGASWVTLSEPYNPNAVFNFKSLGSVLQ